ncbi:MAG: glycosyl hydrolase 115 family protein [Chitinophagaceae bacterium]|nr:glycosyl hydrolase 115 family protein [Chitinophagaceae bacterium]
MFISLLCALSLHAQKELLVFERGKPLGAFELFSKTKIATLVVDSNDAKVVSLCAKAFLNDVEMLSGRRMPLAHKSFKHQPKLMAGTIGRSVVIDEMIRAGFLDAGAIKGKWECFIIKVVGPDTLVIAGSDPRGTAFGIFHLSELLGVSPWVLWADAMPSKKSQMFIKGSFTSMEPSVKYRGIFLNDEDWGLQPWAAKTFEPETGDIGPKTYSKIFELLLRLKANLFWPAMHDCTKAFFQIEGNQQIAADYGMVAGTSHAEPMLRNNVGEWDQKAMGPFNYISNKEKVYAYWEERVKQSKGMDAVYSMGMRGVHDSKMEGVKNEQEAAALMEGILSDQRGLLAKYIHNDVTTIPQAFTAYKEVLDIYDAGLKLPDDITLVWPDDNYGYIQRLNNHSEKERSGGSGVYYHASYWGRPHDYLWLGTTLPVLMQSEMMKAFSNGANRIWVLNVGDIKPLEYSIELFLDMAYDAAPFQTNAFAKQHHFNWLKNLFGQQMANSIHPILWEYYNLAYQRRPEFMGWSQTEPTTKTNYSTFNHFYFGDEAQKRIQQYQLIEDKVKVLRKQIHGKDSEAFYQLVYYPVVGASHMNKKFLYRDKAYLYAKQNRLSALTYSAMSKAAYDSIVAETAYFNTQLSEGKWKHMMSMQPRNLPVFLEPDLPVITMDRKSAWVGPL